MTTYKDRNWKYIILLITFNSTPNLNSVRLVNNLIKYFILLNKTAAVNMTKEFNTLSIQYFTASWSGKNMEVLYKSLGTPCAVNITFSKWWCWEERTNKVGRMLRYSLRSVKGGADWPARPGVSLHVLSLILISGHSFLHLSRPSQPPVD